MSLVILKKIKNEFIFFLATIRSFFKYIFFLKYFLFIYLVYFVGYFTLIINNIDYADDNHRAAYGVTHFSFWSRFSSEIITRILHVNLYRNIEISPLMQLLSIALLSLGSIILVKIVLNQYSLYGLLASTPLGLSPYFLENMSYKFDSIFMSIAIFLPIFAFLFLRRKVLFFIISVICLEITLTTYQAGNSVFIILSMFTILKLIIKNKDYKIILSHILLFLSIFVFSFLIYKIFIMVKFEPGYVTTTIFSIENILSGVKENIKILLKTYEETFKNTIFIPIFILGILIFQIISVNLSRSNIFFTFIASLLFTIGGLIISYGAYILLEKPLFSPRALNGFGVLVSIIFIFLIKAKSAKLEIINRFLILVLSYSLIVQSTAYANALKKQTQYAKYRFELMLNDLNKIIPEDKKFMFISRGAPASLEALNSSKTFPIISKTHVFNVNWLYWDYGLFENYEIWGKEINGLCSQKNKKEIYKIHTAFHEIIKYDNRCIVIEFFN